MPGIRQRLAAASALTTSLADDAPVGIEYQSNLGTRLLLQWGRGTVSASEVQRLARAAVLDGLLHHEIASLASIGNWGQMPGNCNRDLQRKYHIDYLPAPLVVRVPCIAPKASASWDDLGRCRNHAAASVDCLHCDLAAS